jgi:hypothetical protein
MTATVEIQPLHECLHDRIAGKNYATILDIGAWFCPYPFATHVIDVMPWETRACKLQLEKQPFERFSKETWFALDVCDPSKPFPFADKSIDLVVCSGTLEDLPHPQHCAREMQRVGRAGYIRVPTALSELTIGVSDRACSSIGYPHHHWICRESSEHHLIMMPKEAADLKKQRGEYIPLTYFERKLAEQPERFARDINFFWEDRCDVQFRTDSQVRDEVKAYLASLAIPRSDYVRDTLLRAARRTRTWLRGKKGQAGERTDWWQEMLQLSKPYMSPEMYRLVGGKD